MKSKLSLLLMSMIGFTYANIIGGTGPYTNITSYSTHKSDPRTNPDLIYDGLVLVDATGKIFTSVDGGTNWSEPSNFTGSRSNQYFAYSDNKGSAYLWRKSGKAHFVLRPGQAVQPGTTPLKLGLGESIVNIGSQSSASQYVLTTSKDIFEYVDEDWTKTPIPTNVSFYGSLGVGRFGYILFSEKHSLLLSSQYIMSQNSNPCFPQDHHDSKPKFLLGTSYGFYVMCNSTKSENMAFFHLDKLQNEGSAEKYYKWSQPFGFNSGAALPSSNANDYSFAAATIFKTESMSAIQLKNPASSNHPFLNGFVPTVIVTNYIGGEEHKSKSHVGALFARLCLEGKMTDALAHRDGISYSCSLPVSLLPPGQELVSAGAIAESPKIGGKFPKLHAVFVTKNPGKANRVLDIPLLIEQPVKGYPVISIDESNINWN